MRQKYRPISALSAASSGERSVKLTPASHPPTLTPGPAKLDGNPSGLIHFL